MLELSIPKVGEEVKSSKDLVFNILLNEEGLTLMKIYRNIKKEYNVSITYQAVRKAVDNLVKQKLLIKKAKIYSINDVWLRNLKSFVDQALSSGEKGKNIHKFDKKMFDENYSVYTLNSLFELDNFWGDILLYLAKNLKKGEKKVSINLGHYTWWVLVNLGRETKLYQEFKEKSIKTYFLWLKRNSLNENAAKIYFSMGHKSKIISKDIIEENMAINTLGDTTIQVEYPKEIIKEIRNYFKKHNKDNFNMKEITKIVHKPCKIKFIIFKNKEFAKNFNEKYLRYFKK